MPAGERTVDFDAGVGQIRIGRRADLELSLPFSRLSGVHARLVRANDGDGKADHWLLEDLGSTNGTFVGGERLKPGAKCIVSAGMQFKFAEIQVIFDGEVRRATTGKVPVAAPIKDTGKVHAEAPPRDTGKVQADPSGKVQAEASTKETAKTHAEVPGRVAAKVQSEASAKSTSGKVQGDAVNRDTGKVQAEAPRKDTGQVTTLHSDGSNKGSGRTHNTGHSQSHSHSKSPITGQSQSHSHSHSKSPIVDPTQTYVRGQVPDSFSPGAPVEAVPYLTAVAGLKEGAVKFRLEEHNHVYMFGRTRRCEFRVNTAEVSREHASFTRRSDGIYVNDLESVNGVLVNNTRVREYRLFDGDLVQIGHVKLRLFDPTETGGRRTDSAVATPSRLAPAQSLAELVAPRYEPAPPARADASSTFHSERSDYHPAIAGALAQEGVSTDDYRPRRPSVRVRITQSWESSSRLRYGIVIVAASLLAICAVLVGFKLAG
jgi:pSer/pThr/pTyr-binding forkhead associated (FHA) protein